MKYIVSFTTTPIRINKCKQMLESILNQKHKPDKIILNIPHIFQRTNETYNIPEYVEKNVFINYIDKDYGPGTKLIPTIKYLNENNYDKELTRIIYLDDDIFYPKNMIKDINKIVKQNDDDVYCSAGFDIIDFKPLFNRNHGKIVSVAEGYGGVCVKLNVFKEDFFDYIEKYNNIIHCKLSDDIMFSNYYYKQGVKIKIFSIPQSYSVQSMWEKKYILDYGREEDALHNGASGLSTNNIERYKKVIFILNKEKERFFKIGLVNSNNSINYL